VFPALALITACSQHNGELNGSSGNVRVVLTAAEALNCAGPVNSAAALVIES
jgi:hypothetical protein